MNEDLGNCDRVRKLIIWGKLCHRLLGTCEEKSSFAIYIALPSKDSCKDSGVFLFVSLAQKVDLYSNLKKVHLVSRYIQLSPTVISRDKPVTQAQLWTQVESERKTDYAQQSQNQFSPILGSHWHPQHRQCMGLNKTRRVGASLDISSTCSYCFVQAHCRS